MPVDSRSMVVQLYPPSLHTTRERELESTENTRCCLWACLRACAPLLLVATTGKLYKALTLDEPLGPDSRATQGGSGEEEEGSSGGCERVKAIESRSTVPSSNERNR